MQKIQREPSGAANPADPEIIDPSMLDPRRPLAHELEQHLADGFILSAVGDCVLSRQMSPYRRIPAFAQAIEILQSSTAVYGNLETVILDQRYFEGAPHAWAGDWPLTCEPAAARDLAALGFDLLSRANNHALDWGLEGMRECSRWLDEAGLIHAGCGETAGLARQARYFESDKGRVGIVSCVTTYRETTDALPARGAARPRPGVSGLALTRTVRVPQEIWDSIRSLGDTLERHHLNRGALGQFEVDPSGGSSYHYEMAGEDVGEILTQIRQGKQNSDFLIAAIHSHEQASDQFPGLPADFLQRFARKAIEAGAGAVLSTGIHHLGPIEIYQGRPILYGLGNFFWSDLQEPIPADLYRQNWARLAAAFRHPERATDADLTLLMNHPDFTHQETFDGVIAQMAFGSAGLEQIKLFPLDLGYGRPLPESGLPCLAEPAAAERILTRLATISQAYGTHLRTGAERGTTVGMIDMPAPDPRP